MSIRILVVEDEPKARSALHEYFALRGLDVRSAADAGEAIEIARKFAPQVLLCDWWLGGESDGVAVAKTLSERIDDLHILLMTGHSRENLGRVCADLEVKRIYQKPVPVADLCTDIELIAREEKAKAARNS